MLLAEEPWDLYVAVLTETDRLYHFLWNAMAAGEERAVDLFQHFHAAVDRFVGWLVDSLPDGTQLVILSDHGFAAERRSVYTNAWLRERGFLAFDVDEPKGLGMISPASTVYSLDPGRFYVNRAGGRARGGVPPERAGPWSTGWSRSWPTSATRRPASWSTASWSGARTPTTGRTPPSARTWCSPCGPATS